MYVYLNCRSCDYLRQERDSLQQQLNDYRRQEEQTARERRQERLAWFEDMKRTANNWPEAFNKQKKRINSELSEFPEQDPWFLGMLREVEQAERIYLEERKSTHLKINKLKQELRQTVIARIRAEIESDYSMQDLCDALTEDDPTSWLQW